ncbi:MAG: dihydroorotase [Clostridia bacterium]|nr:dihydroorotase [Clostridia bacterium]
MRVYIRNTDIYTENGFRRGNALVGGGEVRFFFENTGSVPAGAKRIDGRGKLLIPALVDVHTHLREPGFAYKETIKTGSLAALRSGYCAIYAMPNLDPVPDSAGHLKLETDIIARDAAIPVYPYGAITVGEKGETLADIEGMTGAAAFSDDGRGVQSEEMMREAMKRVRKTGKILAAHCEVNDLLRGGYIHDGAYARAHGHRGICSESEWRQIERDLALAAETGCPYHVCHISTKESVALIREAKARGVDVTCETAPHYLLLDENDLREDGRFKMNPPLRAREDREALLEGLADGTVDMIATDHAPHSAEEKGRGLEKSAMGIVGLETAFPALYTELVLGGVISLEKLVELMSLAPAKRFGADLADCWALMDVESEYKIAPEEFVSMGRATPFAGKTVRGKCVMTAIRGEIRFFAEPIFTDVEDRGSDLASEPRPEA